MKTITMNKYIGVALLMLLIPVCTFGATMKAGEEVTISKGNDIEDNLYVAGGNVSINSIVNGDLITAGGNILITENVTQDIAVAGGSITILGDTGDDVRAAGGNILIAGNVAGELVVAGGSVTVSSDVSIGEDLIVLGGQAAIDGNVAGDVQITAGVASINGRVQGDVKVLADEKITIGAGAVIEGDLTYSAKNAEALQLSDGAVVTGEITFNAVEGGSATEAQNVLFAMFGAFVLFKLAAFLITALILTWLFKNFSNTVVQGAAGNPLRMLGYGFIAAIVLPVAAILLLVTLFGIPLGIMALLSYALLLLVAGVYAGVVAGAWLGQMIRKAPTAFVTWKNVIGGTVLLAFVNLVPVVGWIVGLLVFLVTVGSIADLLHKKVWTQR